MTTMHEIMKEDGKERAHTKEELLTAINKIVTDAADGVVEPVEASSKLELITEQCALAMRDALLDTLGAYNLNEAQMTIATTASISALLADYTRKILHAEAVKVVDKVKERFHESYFDVDRLLKGTEMGDTILISSEMWRILVSTKDALERLDPVDKYALVLEGHLGKIDNRFLRTDGYHPPELQVFDTRFCEFAHFKTHEEVDRILATDEYVNNQCAKMFQTEPVLPPINPDLKIFSANGV